MTWTLRCRKFRETAMIDPIECTICGEEKDKTQFYKDRRQCKPCYNGKNMESVSVNVNKNNSNPQNTGMNPC